MQRLAVGLRVNRDGLDPQLAAGADDAQGDLAAIGNQDFVKHGRSMGAIESLDAMCSKSWYES
jgi:hypothetical protein